MRLPSVVADPPGLLLPPAAPSSRTSRRTVKPHLPPHCQAAPPAVATLCPYVSPLAHRCSSRLPRQASPPDGEADAPQSSYTCLHAISAVGALLSLLSPPPRRRCHRLASRQALFLPRHRRRYLSQGRSPSHGHPIVVDRASVVGAATISKAAACARVNGCCSPPIGDGRARVAACMPPLCPRGCRALLRSPHRRVGRRPSRRIAAPVVAGVPASLASQRRSCTIAAVRRRCLTVPPGRRG